MENQLISIIVPCYNQVGYIDECLESVLNQTYNNWECIIVNDGSSDNTEEIALQWVNKDNRFKYLYKENGGLSSARNAGIEIAKGEWILPLDCDDIIGNQYLELASYEFNNGYELIYANAYFIYANGLKKWNLPDYEFQKILYFNHIYCSAFFKKLAWINAKGYDENLIYGREDWDFWLSILNKNSKVLKLNYDGFYYRRKDISMDSIINSDNKKMKYSEEYIFKKHIYKYLDLNNNILEAFKLLKTNSDKYILIKNEVNKNIVTKFLYKLINFLN